MIELFCGKIGGGKTLSAIARLTKYIANGGTVCTNITLDIPALEKYLKYRYNWIFQRSQYIPLKEEQIYDFYKFTPEGTKDLPSLVIIDEAHLYFNARQWNKLSMDLITFITQSRKCHTDIIFITQAESTLDKQLRLQAMYMWRFRDLQGFTMPFIKIGYPFPHMLERQYPMDLTTIRTPIKTRVKKKDKMLYPIYNTVELLREFPRLEKKVVKRIDTGHKISRYEIKKITMAFAIMLLVLSPKIYGYFKNDKSDTVVASISIKPKKIIKSKIFYLEIFGYGFSENKKYLQLLDDVISLGDNYNSGQIVYMDTKSFIVEYPDKSPELYKQREVIVESIRSSLLRERTPKITRFKKTRNPQKSNRESKILAKIRARAIK